MARLCELPLEDCAACRAMARDANGIEYHAESPESFYQSQARNLRYWRTLDDYDLQARDSDWIARELGDVEYRVGTFQGIQVECGPNLVPASWVPLPPIESGSIARMPDGSIGRLIPVESLGRDA